MKQCMLEQSVGIWSQAWSTAISEMMLSYRKVWNIALAHT